MPRGCNPLTNSVLRRAAACVEPLEKRQMLTTLLGNESYDYYDAEGKTIRITLTGEIVAEALFARVNKNNNSVIIRDLVEPPVGDQETDGADLFSLYIAAASPDAMIAISEIRIVNGRVTVVPYTGEDFSLNVVNSQTGEGQKVDVSGSVYIGARTVDIEETDDDESGFPITYNDRFRIERGERPATRGVYAGIQTAPGVSLNKVFVAGTVTGLAYFDGNLGTFYAGDILTGTADGLVGASASPLTNNFFVGGDLRNLVTSNNVGGNESVAGVATYRTGFDLRVGGKLGNTTVNGAFNGTVEVVNNPEINGIETPFEELEYVPLTGETPGAVFLTGLLATDVVRNDRPQDVQYGSSIGSVISGDISGVDFSGSINTVRGDSVDSFGVPLISGQTITVLLDSELGVLNVGIFDPLGRLVATDIGNATGRGDGEQFRYTAETPGVYRLAVATTGNSTFSSDGDGAAVDNYTLSVQGFSPVAIGGMRVGGDATFGEIGFFGLPGAPRTAATGVLVRTGDIGALDIDGGLYAQFGSVIQARRGNLRALYGREIGEVDPEQVLVPELDIPRGTVGHIRSLGTLHINQTASDGVDFIPSRAIGFDYQRVEAAGDFVGNLVANGSIGGVFAGSVGTSEVTSAPLFVANADRNDENGRIDLIDVTGDFGSDEIGGPGLFTGRGGNVKYVRVGGTVVSDQYFGGSLSSEIQGAPGETLRVTDDSGATAVLIPTSQTQTTPGGGSTPGGTVTAPGSIRLTSYGVREAGGVVLINVTASTNVTVQASGGAGTVDISQLNINGSGSTLAYNGDTRRVGYVIPTTGGNTGGGGGAGGDGTSAAPVRVVPRNPGATTVASTSDPRAPTNGTFTPAPSTTPTQTIGAPAIAGNVLSSAPQIRNDLTFAGRLPINVFEIAAVNLTNVINGTAGEIVGMEAYTVAAIQAQSLGYMKTSIPGKIAVASNNPVTLATQPFDPYTYGLYINGPVVDVLSREAIGNLYVYGATATSEGVVRNIRANADQRGTRGMFEGITGVVAAENIQSIDVGEGLAFSGTGDVINGGIYGIEGGPNDATAEIGTVVANNADIRGQIGSEGVIRSIIVNNGSINSARIGITTTIGQLRYANSEPITLPDAETEVIPGSRPANPGTGTPGTAPTRVAYSLGTINVNGYGGIINTAVSAADFQAINVNGGFGIISSTFGSTGTFNSSGLIQTDGLGIRNTAIDAGTSINSVTARGEGQRLDVRDYDPRVRFSERGRFDPESGRWLDGSNDLHRAIGTNRRSSRVSGLTNSGIIENTRILGEGDLVNGVRAFAIRAVPRAGAIPGTAELPPTSSRYPMTISFANSSGTIDVLNNVDGLQMVTGRIRNFRTGGNVEDLNASVSGLIANIDIGGILRRTATFDARGPQGQIRDVRVARSLLGRVTSTLDIDGVDVGSLGGTVASVGRINNLTVRGDVLSGGYARGAKGIGVLRVGGDVLEGGVISARSYGTTRIGGTVFGDVIVD